MTYQEYTAAVLGKTLSSYIDTLDHEERDEDGRLQFCDPESLEERLLERLVDALNLADVPERLALLTQGIRGFRQLVLDVQKGVNRLPMVSSSDREDHLHEVRAIGSRRRARMGADQ